MGSHRISEAFKYDFRAISMALHCDLTRKVHAGRHPEL